MDLDITSPLRTAEDLAAAYKMKDERDDLDLVYSVTESRRNPLLQHGEGPRRPHRKGALPATGSPPASRPRCSTT